MIFLISQILRNSAELMNILDHFEIDLSKKRLPRVCPNPKFRSSEFKLGSTAFSDCAKLVLDSDRGAEVAT